MRLMIAVFLCGMISTVYGQNLQTYTPSILFEKGEFEVKSFQNLYAQTKSFKNAGGKEATGRGREIYFTNINQVLYGLSDQFNIGFDVWVKHVSLEDASLNSRTAVTGIGPKIKIAPFKSIPNLSIQSTFLLPLDEDLESRMIADQPFLEFDKSLWLTQFYYDHAINDQLQLFIQQAFWYHFVRESFRENNFLQTQTSLFLSYFPTSRWTFYGMTEYFPTHYHDGEQSFDFSYSYFVQLGGGLKYQIIPQMLELELLYTNFILGSAGNGAGQTFNLGIRFVRQ